VFLLFIVQLLERHTIFEDNEEKLYACAFCDGSISESVDQSNMVLFVDDEKRESLQSLHLEELT
jgi:hypothetical protein